MRQFTPYCVGTALRGNNGPGAGEIMTELGNFIFFNHYVQ